MSFALKKVDWHVFKCKFSRLWKKSVNTVFSECKKKSDAKKRDELALPVMINLFDFLVGSVSLVGIWSFTQFSDVFRPSVWRNLLSIYLSGSVALIAACFATNFDSFFNFYVRGFRIVLLILFSLLGVVVVLYFLKMKVKST
jgi:hypothetical protein